MARAEEFLKRRIPIGSTTKVSVCTHQTNVDCRMAGTWNGWMDGRHFVVFYAHSLIHSTSSAVCTLRCTHHSSSLHTHPPTNTQQTSRIQEEATGQGYSHPAIIRAISILVRRGDLLERDQGRVLKRLR